jgi:hypothetical protein
MLMLRRLTLAVLVITAACGGDAAGPATIPAELVGTWVAEPACVPDGCGLTLKSVADPAISFFVTDLITTQITIRANGSFLLETLPTAPGMPAISGTARAVGNVLYVKLANGTEESLEWSVAGTWLTVRFHGTYDFNGDGVSEAAVMDGVFRKR